MRTRRRRVRSFPHHTPRTVRGLLGADRETDARPLETRGDGKTWPVATEQARCGLSRDESRGEGRMRVEAAVLPGEIENLAREVEPRDDFGLHRGGIDLGEHDASV